MTTTRSTHRQLDAGRRATLAAGLFYVATFVFSIPAAFVLYDKVLNDPAFVFGAGSVTPVQWGAFFEVLTALTGIGTAVALYPVIKRHGPAGAIGFVASRTLEASMIFAGVLTVLAVCTLRDPSAGSDAGGITASVDSLLALKDWTFLLGPGYMPVINALCLAPILYRARLVPRMIPMLGMIGAPMLFLSTTLTLFGVHEQTSTTAGLLVVPIFIWELSLGLWMTFKGFRSSEPAPERPVVGEPLLVGAVA